MQFPLLNWAGGYIQFFEVRPGTKSYSRTLTFFINFKIQHHLMLDSKGSFYIMDAILAIFLLLMVFLVVNTAITVPTSDYSYESKDIRTAQDTMELLGGKIDFNDNTFLGKISKILEDNKNSKQSVRCVRENKKKKKEIFKI